MANDAALACLFGALDTLAAIARHMDPGRLKALIGALGDRDAGLAIAAAGSPSPIATAAGLALRAHAGLRAAPDADNPMMQAYRAMRQYYRSLEALAPLTEIEPAVSRYFLEPDFRDDAALLRRLAEPPHPDSGTFHFDNETEQRGGFSVYVPSWYDPSRSMPVIMGLHGGSGHGRLFIWNWVAEARSRGAIVIAPTAVGSTWSLMEPDVDVQNFARILDQVSARWNIDPARMLLTGMSDGGTFTLVSGLADDSPFTHLAPTA
ncbi:MAG TPA: hypothetical protein VGM32_04920, partial [Rhodopila sp.]